MTYHYYFFAIFFLSFFLAQVRGKHGNDNIEHYLERKCLKNANAEAYKDLKLVVIEKSKEISNLTHPTNDQNTYILVCIDLAKFGYVFLKSVMEKLKYCLDEEAKFLTDFMLSTFNNTIKFHCDGGFDVFKEKLDALSSSKCNTSYTMMPQLLAEVCVPKLLFLNNEKNYDIDFVVTESYFCSELENESKCITETLYKDCTNDFIPKLAESLLASAVEWCKTNHPLNLVNATNLRN